MSGPLAMTSDLSPEALAFVFTDLESSTRLWERFPDAMKGAMERHDAILRNAVDRGGGSVVKATGDGLMAVFTSSAGAVKACLEAQEALQDEAWEDTGALRVRMGIHVGEAQRRAGDYYGPSVNRAARIMAAANGGQVLLSALAARLAEGRLPAQAALRDLGEHRLRDLSQPEHIFQLVHPALPSDLPPIATLGDRPNNLPTQTSEFLGREAQLSAIRDLLDATGVRLLTLTGPGGIGKTRLALQGAANQIDRFEDGVFFVDLSPVRERDAAFQAVVRAVGVSANAEELPLESLKEQLRTRQLLLVLDNFEQVMDAADGVAELLRHCPELKALVTSREALRVRGEHLLRVPSLSLPDEQAGEPTAELVAGYEAVGLFVERAREVEPGFALTDENAAAVAEVCSRLDGLPLAIELAAARLTLFSLDELRDRLRSRLDVLRGGPRDLPARQQTLRDVIAWSHELLGADERAIFRLLSVFVTARVEAVEAIAARLGSLRGVDVVEGLASLVDKSLVRSVEGPGSRRLSMLETIREYAAERLDDEPELGSAARRAHAEYFSDFALERRDRLYGPGRDEALDELGVELGNLLAAWRYWVDARDPQGLNKLLDGLWALHDARGWYHAAVELADDLLGVLAVVPSTADRVREQVALHVSLARGLMAIRGYTEEVEDNYNRALSLAKQTGDLPQESQVLRSLANFYLYRGEFEQSASVGRQLLELAEQQGDTGLQVEGRLIVGSNISFLGDIETGLDHLDRAIALFDPERHRPGRFRFGANPGAAAYTTSALLHWLRGFPDRSACQATRGIDLAKQLNHPFTQAYILFHTALLDLWREELALVHERAVSVLEVAEEHGYQVWGALALALQGVAATGLGRPEEGLARMEQGIDRYQGLTTPPVFWPLVLSVRARGLWLGGRPAEGLDPIDQAIEMTGGTTFLYPEFALLKAELLLGLDDRDSALLQLRSAFDVAGDLGLRMPQLRAATRLTRLQRDSGSRSEATDLLRRVYETFTEGFDARDLVAARAALGTGALGAPRSPVLDASARNLP
jgi:predicted ATPase/class 3 adenylate cyclase